MQINEYGQHDRLAIIRMLERFQDFLIELDPLRRLQRPPGYGEAALQRALTQVAENKGVFYVATENDRAVGFLTAIVLPPITLDDVGAIDAARGRITELYVDTPWRGKGVGRRLMEKAEDYLNGKGCHLIKVEVFAPNAAAHEFYKRLGYQDYDVDMMKRAGG